MKLDSRLQSFLPLGFWWLGSGVLVSVLWLVSLLLQVDILQTATLWFGLWATYLLPGIGLSFALHPKKIDWLERIAWVIGCSLVVMPTLLFGLTAAGLHFSPILQVGVGVSLSILSGIVFVGRVIYGK